MYCTGAAVATQVTTTVELNAAIAGVSGGVPAGLMTVSLTACPVGWAEVSALNGVMLRGTLAASGNVGTTGGSDSRTPAGTIAYPVGVPTFTGASVTSSAVTAGTPSGTNAAITAGTPAGTISALTTGADSSTTGGGEGDRPDADVYWLGAATHTHTFTGSALATHTHTTTATGTISWPAGVPTFAGTAFDNRPAYLNVIFCAKQ
jgi:hypothetical protein